MACYLYWLINFKIFENTALGHVTEVPIDIARDRRKTLKKKERKTKNEKDSNNSNKYFITFTFLYWKIYNFWKTYLAYLENLSLYCYICITVYSRGKLLEMQ